MSEQKPQPRIDHVTFETDVLRLERSGFYVNRRNRRHNYACFVDLNRYFVMPRDDGSRIVIVFTTKPIIGCPSAFASQLYRAGDVAKRRIRKKLGYKLDDCLRLWWWVEIVEDEE